MSKKVLNLSLWKQADTKTEELKMKKEKTLQEVQEQISELQEEREKCDVKLKQLQNQGKKLEKLANEKERKRRNHRLIQRGLIVERVIENSLMFANEEIEELLKVATDTEEYRQAYEEMINGKDMEDETDICLLYTSPSPRDRG